MQNNSRDKIKEINEQRLHERFKELQGVGGSVKNPIDDLIGREQTSAADTAQSYNEEEINTSSLTSLQDRFGVRKINRPVKDAQLTARIDSRTLKQFKNIVKQMYYPDKPNINETVTQIIRAFVDEYNKSEKHGKQNTDEQASEQ